ncbi:unnamed protein product [Boreogadus saida]
MNRSPLDLSWLESYIGSHHTNDIISWTPPHPSPWCTRAGAAVCSCDTAVGGIAMLSSREPFQYPIVSQGQGRGMRPAFPRHVGVICAALASSVGAGARADGCLSYRPAGVANEHANLTATGQRGQGREEVVSAPVEPDDEADGWMDEVGLGVTPAEAGSRCEGVEHGGPSILSAYSTALRANSFSPFTSN